MKDACYFGDPDEKTDGLRDYIVNQFIVEGLAWDSFSDGTYPLIFYSINILLECIFNEGKGLWNSVSVHAQP